MELDDMVDRFKEAIASNWNNDTQDARDTTGELAAQAYFWQGRANYWRGKYEAREEYISYLKERLFNLDADHAPKIDLEGPNVRPG